jgi:hypothetical protein
MIYTPKLNLNKPESTDYLSPDPFNDNADILDDAMLASTYDPDGDGIVLEAIKATEDSNGDPIISTYLPLVAGSTHPITGDLYVKNDSLTQRAKILFDKNDVIVGEIQGGNTLALNKLDGNGIVTDNIAGRVSFTYDDEADICDAFLSAREVRIFLRPKGINDHTAEFIFNKDGVLSVPGDVTRANPTIRENSVSNVSVATGNQKLVGITNIPKGRYLIDAYVQFAAASTGGNAFINLYKNADNPSRPIIYSSHYVNRLSNYFHDATWATFTDNVSDLSLFFEPNVTGTVTYGYIGIIRLS